MLNAGRLPCRPSIFIDKLLKPLPTTASEGTESLAFTPSPGKRMRREDASGNLGRAEEEDHASQIEAHEVEGDAVKLGCQGTAAADSTTNAGVTAEVGPAQTEEASTGEVVTMGVDVPRIVADEAAAGEAAAKASSGPAGDTSILHHYFIS
jgi:hypothetical protein